MTRFTHDNAKRLVTAAQQDLEAVGYVVGRIGNDIVIATEYAEQVQELLPGWRVLESYVMELPQPTVNQQSTKTIMTSDGPVSYEGT